MLGIAYHDNPSGSYASEIQQRKLTPDLVQFLAKYMQCSKQKHRKHEPNFSMMDPIGPVATPQI